MELFWIVRDVVFWISALPTRCISDCAIRLETRSNKFRPKIVSSIQKTTKQSRMFFELIYLFSRSGNIRFFWLFFPRFFLAGEGE